MLDLANIWRKPQSFEGTDHYGSRLNNLTSTQRDALTGSGAPKAGSLIYNTTTNAVEVYNGSAWIALPNNLDATEFGFLDGVSAGTVTASKALVVDANKDLATLRDLTMRHLVSSGNITNGGNLLTSSTLGTVTTGATTTAEEHGDGLWHITKLTLTAFAVGTSGDNEDLAIGASLYTFPAGAIQVGSVSLVGALTAAISVTTIGDGEIGLGTTIGSTAVDTLGEVAAGAENLLEGDVGALSSYVADGTSTLTLSDNAGLTAQTLAIASGGGHAVHLNVAATWPDVDAAGAVTFTGVITIQWRKIS